MCESDEKKISGFTLTHQLYSVILLAIFELFQQSLLLQVLSPARFPQQYSDF
jgi:hypothetical protein